MPKRAEEWGALDVKRAVHSGVKDKNEWRAVGGVAGLQLQITPNDSKSWILRTMVGNVRRSIGLGAYPEVGIAAARERAREARSMIEQGVDPIEERKAARSALAAAARRNLTFAEVADEWITAKLHNRPEKSQRAVRSTLERYAFPAIGAMVVKDIINHDVERAVKELFLAKPETFSKLRSYIENILTWATIRGYRTGENPARWAGNLVALMPEREKLVSGNFPAVQLKDAPQFWAELCRRGGTAAMALRFAGLCASRSGEVRGATWGEIDFSLGIWAIPAERMKAKEPHRVPLSPTSLAVLDALPRLKGNPLVFPSPTGKPLSDMSVSAVMRRMQEDAEAAAERAGLPREKAGWRDAQSGRPAVPHGLRSTFRDWAAERGIDHFLAEIALAHKVGSAVERAYRRSDVVELRRAMMVRWADFLEGRGEKPSEPPPIAVGGDLDAK